MKKVLFYLLQSILAIICAISCLDVILKYVDISNISGYYMDIVILLYIGLFTFIYGSISCVIRNVYNYSTNLKLKNIICQTLYAVLTTITIYFKLSNLNLGDDAIIISIFTPISCIVALVIAEYIYSNDEMLKYISMNKQSKNKILKISIISIVCAIVSSLIYIIIPTLIKNNLIVKTIVEIVTLLVYSYIIGTLFINRFYKKNKDETEKEYWLLQNFGVTMYDRYASLILFINLAAVSEINLLLSFIVFLFVDFAIQFTIINESNPDIYNYTSCSTDYGKYDDEKPFNMEVSSSRYKNGFKSGTATTTTYNVGDISFSKTKFKDDDGTEKEINSTKFKY